MGGAASGFCSAAAAIKSHASKSVCFVSLSRTRNLRNMSVIRQRGLIPTKRRRLDIYMKLSYNI